MKTREMTIGSTTVQAVEIPLPNAVLVLISAPKGYLMCGYLNMEAAERFGDRAAVIKGVKTADELLKGKVADATSAAAKAGIEPGMTGLQALEKLL